MKPYQFSLVEHMDYKKGTELKDILMFFITVILLVLLIAVIFGLTFPFTK